MTRTFRSLCAQAGVTLLEIMLVLSIAGVIILMSIRYYQGASNANQANQLLAIVTGIQAAADSIAQGATGSYGSVTSANLTNLLGSQGLITPWGGAITVTGTSTTTYTISISNTPGNACHAILAKLETNKGYGTPTCPNVGATGPFSYTYTSGNS